MPFFLIALIGSAITILALSAVFGMASACNSIGASAGHPVISGAGFCAEYWINRYQAGLAGIFAAAAAWAALKQLKAAREQGNAATNQAIISNLDFWERRLHKIEELQDLYVQVNPLMANLHKIAYYDNDSETEVETRSYQILQDIVKIFEKVDRQFYWMSVHDPVNYLSRLRKAERAIMRARSKAWEFSPEYLKIENDRNFNDIRHLVARDYVENLDQEREFCHLNIRSALAKLRGVGGI